MLCSKASTRGNPALRRTITVICAVGVVVAACGVASGAENQSHPGTTKIPAAVTVTIPESSFAMLGIVPMDQGGRVLVRDTFVGGPAQLAGIQAGDQVVSINGQPVGSADELVTLVRGYKPNTRVDVLINRNGWTRHAMATLVRRGDVSTIRTAQAANDARRERRYSYETRSNDFIDENTALNIYDPYLRALYTAFGQ